MRKPKPVGDADPHQGPAFGFLTVVDQAPLGLLGGYLVLNAAGRPLEFHCTAAVKASRAQEILFGATLEPYLYGEQIGHTLISKAAVEPCLVLTDVSPVLAVRDYVSPPVAWLTVEPEPNRAEHPPTEAPKNWRLDGPHQETTWLGGRPVRHVHFGRYGLAVEATHLADSEAALERLAALGPAFDLREPFSRIREAIEESQRSGR